MKDLSAFELFFIGFFIRIGWDAVDSFNVMVWDFLKWLGS